MPIIGIFHLGSFPLFEKDLPKFAVAAVADGPPGSSPCVEG
jgi:hypothetical protein